MDGEIQEIEAVDRAAFRSWLEANHDSEPAVWLIYWRKSSGHPSIEWSEAVDEALCFGWIDSKVQSLDDNRYRQYWTVRKKGSIWSKINKDKIAHLTAAGQMHAAGIAAVERAKADGSWSILDGPEAGIVPDDFAAAMDEAGVRNTFDEFSPSKRKSILAWLAMAKREETRLNRMTKTIAALKTGEKPV